MTKNKFMILLLGFFSVTAMAGNQPSEWGPFVASADNECGAKKDGFVIHADFDANGVSDTARLQQNKDNRVRVAVWMNGKVDPLVLAEEDTDKAGNFIALVRPGRINAFDGVKASKLKISLLSLSYGTCESSEQVFEWNKKKKKFISAWISD